MMFRLAMIAVALLFLTAIIVCAQPPGKAGGLEQYRNHFLKSSDEEPKNGAVKVTFLGTSTLLFDDGETQIMIDGFFTRPALLRVARGNLETDTKAVDAALKRAKVERLKALFVAHSHYDHAFDAAYVAKQTKAKLHGSASTLNIGRGGNVPEDQLVLFKPGKDVTIGRFIVTVLEGKHSPPMKGINDDLGQTIDKPLKQPASSRDYKEGGSFDFLIKHGENSALVQPSANFVEGALDKVRANVYFLGTATLGQQTKKLQDAIYEQTVKKVKPQLVIPIHWDNFFKPLSENLEPLPKGIDDIPAGFDYLIDRLKTDKIQFGIMQGYQSVLIFVKKQ
jgi:L-ascorbate metabolism protein UlaG (beta-lactamase superfamily)